MKLYPIYCLQFTFSSMPRFLNCILGFNALSSLAMRHCIDYNCMNSCYLCMAPRTGFVQKDRNFFSRLLSASPSFQYIDSTWKVFVERTRGSDTFSYFEFPNFVSSHS